MFVQRYVFAQGNKGFAIFSAAKIRQFFGRSVDKIFQITCYFLPKTKKASLMTRYFCPFHRLSRYSEGEQP